MNKYLSENAIIKYLESKGFNKTKPGLSRTLGLLKKFDNPHQKLKFIHVAGTNGKGSTCAMLASILKENGQKVGFYPSPYLVDFKERIQVDGKNIESDALVRIANEVIIKSKEMIDHPTYFEMVTVIGMLYFLEQKCDVVILEVGLGGRLDSTNVIEKPILSIITNIGIDHTDFLGSTIEEIAAEKAGIIKENCPVVSYENIDSVKNVLKEVASKNNSRIYFADSSKMRMQSFSLKENLQAVEYNENVYMLSLLGINQINNLAVVLKAIEVLNDNGFNIKDIDAVKGLSNVKWDARFQILKTDPYFVLDGGHNSQCAETLIENLDTYFEDKKFNFILGILKDKDHEKVLNIILKKANHIICVTPNNDRALQANELRKMIVKAIKENNVNLLEKEVETSDKIEDAINKSQAYSHTVCFGSLYLAGEVLKFINIK